MSIPGAEPASPPAGAPAALPAADMIVSTTFALEGFRVVRYLGVVRGIVVRSPTLSQGFLGGLKSMVGGQIGAYTEMCEQARQQATRVMMRHARDLGANAVLGVQYDAATVAETATEVLCYGTAVLIEPVGTGG